MPESSPGIRAAGGPARPRAGGDVPPDQRARTCRHVRLHVGERSRRHRRRRAARPHPLPLPASLARLNARWDGSRRRELHRPRGRAPDRALDAWGRARGATAPTACRRRSATSPELCQVSSAISSSGHSGFWSSLSGFWCWPPPGSGRQRLVFQAAFLMQSACDLVCDGWREARARLAARYRLPGHLTFLACCAVHDD